MVLQPLTLPRGEYITRISRGASTEIDDDNMTLNSQRKLINSTNSAQMVVVLKYGLYVEIQKSEFYQLSCRIIFSFVLY